MCVPPLRLFLLWWFAPPMDLPLLRGLAPLLWLLERRRGYALLLRLLLLAPRYLMTKGVRNDLPPLWLSPLLPNL